MILTIMLLTLPPLSTSRYVFNFAVAYDTPLRVVMVSLKNIPSNSSESYSFPVLVPGTPGSSALIGTSVLILELCEVHMFECNFSDLLDLLDDRIERSSLHSIDVCLCQSGNACQFLQSPEI